MAQALVLVALATAVMRRNTLRHPSTVTSNACPTERRCGDHAGRSRCVSTWTHRRRPGHGTTLPVKAVGLVPLVTSTRTHGFEPAAVDGAGWWDVRVGERGVVCGDDGQAERTSCPPSRWGTGRKPRSAQRSEISATTTTLPDPAANALVMRSNRIVFASMKMARASSPSTAFTDGADGRGQRQGEGYRHVTGRTAEQVAPGG